MTGPAPLLEIRDLSVHFARPRPTIFHPVQTLRAVDHVSLTLNEGECLSIVGESGCGKSTTALAVMGLQFGALMGNNDGGGRTGRSQGGSHGFHLATGVGDQRRNTPHWWSEKWI